MSLAQIIAFLSPFESLIKSGGLALSAEGSAELSKLIGSISSPDLKLLAQSLESGLAAFVQAEINKLP